ncbi:MAG TPA: M67 family metallopeptidase [Candidatus Limnocylindrales bacterium]|nr:M67 family metallopeptidase [Candidatus Limnocylindrales bacterium]
MAGRPRPFPTAPSSWSSRRWPGAPIAPRSLRLPSALREALVAHAREGAPDEVCGVLAGRAGLATRLIRCANVAPSPRTRYLMAPREQLAVFREMDAAGEELVAIYHSHPATEPRPSATDVAEAHYPDAFYVLVSLRGPEPELAAWTIRGGAIAPVAIDG